MTLQRPAIPLALALSGMSVRGRRAGPCQACGAFRTDSDGRLPVHFGAQGWRCAACKATGDGFALLGYHLGHNPPLLGRAFVQVLRFAETGDPKLPMEQLDDDEPERIDPMPALERAVPLTDPSVSRDVVKWLERRRIPRHAPAGYLRGFTTEWWPDGKSWPIVVPACTGSGEVVSLQGRAVGDAPTKTRWPKGASASGLLFAPPAVRAWMAGRAPPPSVLVVVEGIPDYLTWSAVRPEPCVGLASGGASALRMWRLPSSTRVYCGTHADEAGDRYALDVADALSTTVVVRRFPLHRIVPCPTPPTSTTSSASGP